MKNTHTAREREMVYDAMEIKDDDEDDLMWCDVSSVATSKNSNEKKVRENIVIRMNLLL